MSQLPGKTCQIGWHHANPAAVSRSSNGLTLTAFSRPPSLTVATTSRRPGAISSGRFRVRAGRNRYRSKSRMAHTCVVGLQWGDEAKGKIVDRLSSLHDFVVRYNGGANAGHTVVR